MIFRIILTLLGICITATVIIYSFMFFLIVAGIVITYILGLILYVKLKNNNASSFNNEPNPDNFVNKQYNEPIDVTPKKNDQKEI